MLLDKDLSDKTGQYWGTTQLLAPRLYSDLDLSYNMKTSILRASRILRARYCKNVYTLFESLHWYSNKRSKLSCSTFSIHSLWCFFFSFSFIFQHFSKFCLWSCLPNELKPLPQKHLLSSNTESSYSQIYLCIILYISCYLW